MAKNIHTIERMWGNKVVIIIWTTVMGECVILLIIKEIFMVFYFFQIRITTSLPLTVSEDSRIEGFRTAESIMFATTEIQVSNAYNALNPPDFRIKFHLTVITGKEIISLKIIINHSMVFCLEFWER